MTKVGVCNKITYVEIYAFQRFAMENNKRISIIVPVYKTENYLSQCIDSVIGQTYKNIEIILVDDGSPDSCGKICDEYAKKDSRIKVIHQQNKGLCGARNAGMREATGDYIGFVDSDDYIAEDMYEYLCESIEKYGADIVSCRYFRIGRKYDGYEENGAYDVVMTGREAVTELVERFNLRSLFWNKLFRREILSDFEFPQGRTFEGTLTMHRLFLRCEKVVMLKEPKYYYRDNQGSIVNTKSLRNALDCCVANIERYYDLKDSFPALKDKLLRENVKKIRVLRYVSGGIKKEDIDSRREDFLKIKAFVNENREYIYGNILTDIFSKKEMDSILLLTERGFSAAHTYGGFSLRAEKLKKLFKAKINSEETGEEAPPEMTEERKDKLKKLQSVLYEMLGEIDRICRENEITYFLCGGTMLGAAREGGIIEWDDDVDILMLRSDFEKFARVCEKSLPGGYFYQSGFTDSEFSNIAAKIRKNGTYFPEKRWEKRNFNKGIFIDIFPLDEYPDNKLYAKAATKLISFIQQVVSLEKCYSENPVTRALFYLAKKKPPEYWYGRRNKVFSFCARHAGGKYLCSFGSHYKNKRILKKEWFSSCVDVKFGEENRMAPQGWRDYLVYIFGEDYMTPPPEDKRVCHAVLDRIKFGDE